MSRILVTGSSGFLGSHIANRYVAQGHEVLGVDIRMIPHIGFQQKECDLLSMDLPSWLSELKPDVVIHCAGNANVSVSVKDPGCDFQTGVALLHRLFFGVRDAGIRPRFVFLSSAAVYGNPNALPVSETAATRPISPYGLHKRQCEELCEYFHRGEGVPTVVARIFSAYGAGLRKQIFWDLADKLMKGGKVELFGTGDESRDFIHVDDIVQAIGLLADTTTGGVYNLANGQEYSIRHVSTLLAKALGRDTALIGFNGRVKAGDPIHWRADISRLAELGYRQGRSIESGLEEFGRWVQNDAG